MGRGNFLCSWLCSMWYYRMLAFCFVAIDVKGYPGFSFLMSFSCLVKNSVESGEKVKDAMEPKDFLYS